MFKIRSLWRNYNFKFASISARGCSGGILSIWDPLVFEKKTIVSMDNVLIVEGEYGFKIIKCFIINVFAPQGERETYLWDF